MTDAPPTPLIEHALAAARRGIRVFPCVPGTKRPLIKDNLKRATTDEDILRGWWEENPDASPAGVFDLVVDVDVKDGKRGAEGKDLLERLDFLPPTYTQRTPSGGWHLFYRAPGADVPNSVEKIAPGVDVRGNYGFVMLAGAVRPEGVYTVEHDADFAEAPADLVRLCGERRKRDPAAPNGALRDHPADVARAIALLEAATPAKEGQAGDMATYNLACELRGRGIREATAVALMLEHWNERCEPAWDVDDLAQKVSNAYRYAIGAAGEDSVAAQFDLPEVVDDEAGDGSARRAPQTQINFERIKDLRKLPPTRWLIHRWVPEGGVGIFYGKWGSGKSFILMDLGLHLAHGLPNWHGARLPGKPHDVLVLAREGHQGFVKRVDAFKRKHGISDDTDRLTFMRASVSLMRTADFNALCDALRNQEQRFKLVVIDTIARAMPGADMNEQQNVTQFMERCQQIGEVTGAAVIGVHHQNKGGSMLGSVFFEANSDFVFEVTRTGPETGPLSAGEILCTKMKDGEDRWRKAVTYERVALPVSDIEEGDASSLAVAGISDVSGRSGDPSIEETFAAALARNMGGGETRRSLPFREAIKLMSATEQRFVGADAKDHRSRKLIEAFGGDAERLTSFGILSLEKKAGRGGVTVGLRRSAGTGAN